jgi:hypothetical protein
MRAAFWIAADDLRRIDDAGVHDILAASRLGHLGAALSLLRVRHL